MLLLFFFQAEDGIRYIGVTGVQTCALPISCGAERLLGRRPAVLAADRVPRLRRGDGAAHRPRLPERHGLAPAHPARAEIAVVSSPPRAAARARSRARTTG